MAKLGPNLIMFKIKAGIDGVFFFGFKNHAFVCEPKCNKVTWMGNHKSGQTHQGPLNTRDRHSNK